MTLDNEFTLEEGSRTGWIYCPECGAVKPPWHIHGDTLEQLSPGELLQQLRDAGEQLRAQGQEIIELRARLEKDR